MTLRPSRAILLGCAFLASGCGAGGGSPAAASTPASGNAERSREAGSETRAESASTPSPAIGEKESVVFLHVFPAEEEPTLPVGEVRLLGRPGVGGLPNELVRRGWGAWAPGDVLSARLEPRDTGLADPVLPAHTACSFLIDCEEPAVRELAASFRSASNLASDELVAFVSEHIEKKSYGRGFDVASVVATRKEGDCTEHATLLAALARSRGLPARVVLGLALVRLPGGPPQAFGHAWTEIYEQGRWTTQDAALHGILAPPAEEGTKPVRVDYLPLQVITDEGPGFGKQLLSGANVLQMRGVQVPSRSE